MIEKKKTGFEDIGSVDLLLWCIPFIGLYLAVKHYRHKGIIGKLYLTYAWVVTIGFSVSLYLFLK
jgi:hypothetical protein